MQMTQQEGETPGAFRERQNNIAGAMGGFSRLSLMHSQLMPGNRLCPRCKRTNVKGTLFCCIDDRCYEPLVPDAFQTFRSFGCRRGDGSVVKSVERFAAYIGIEFEPPVSRNRPPDGLKAIQMKIKRCGKQRDRKGNDFVGHADRYDNDFQYCYDQRVAFIPRALSAAKTIPQGQKGSGQRTGEFVYPELAYLDCYRWEDAVCYRLIRARIADGTLLPEFADIEPRVEIETAGGEPSSVPIDVKRGWGRLAHFSEHPKWEDSPGTIKSHDNRPQSVTSRDQRWSGMAGRRREVFVGGDRSRSRAAPWDAAGFGGEPPQPGGAPASSGVGASAKAGASA